MKYIGFYDSGVGGLTVYSEFKKIEPQIASLYFADTIMSPLGAKSQAEILQRMQDVMSFMFDQGCDLVILACNTATVNSIRFLQQNWLPKNYPNKQILGISKPFTELLQEKYKQFQSSQGLILATVATIKSGFYQTEFQKIGFQSLHPLPMPELCSAIESQDQNYIQSALRLPLAQVKNIQDIKLVLLACTHYPLVKQELKSYFQQDCQIIDPSFFIAQKITQYLQNHTEYQTEIGNDRFIASYQPEIFQNKANSLFPDLKVGEIR